ncbi:hypothetical protein RhiirB3_457859 [Rhizophagus irregularis]|nr:hypothetical protein RhiirB3_457859 [Rhizophagus irregularis]
MDLKLDRWRSNRSKKIEEGLQEVQSWSCLGISCKPNQTTISFPYMKQLNQSVKFAKNQSGRIYDTSFDLDFKN